MWMCIDVMYEVCSRRGLHCHLRRQRQMCIRDGVEEERHDDTMGKVEVYMHGRRVEMTSSASSPPQVTAFTSPISDASARIEMFSATVRLHPLE